MSDRLLFVPGERLQAAKLNTLGYVTQGWLQYSLTFPYEEPGPWVLPPAGTRAGKLLGFDGAGGPFLFDAGQGVSDLIIATGSVTPRSVQDRFAEVRNVLDFGAINDGVTDSTAAIQAAINRAILDGGNTVLIPEGPGFVHTGLTINGRGVVIDGGGRTHNQTAFGANLIYNGSATGTWLTVSGPCEGAQIKNLHLRKAAPLTLTDGWAIDITGSTLVDVSNVKIAECWNCINIHEISAVTLTRVGIYNADGTYGVRIACDSATPTSGINIVKVIAGGRAHGQNFVGLTIEGNVQTVYVKGFYCNLAKIGIFTNSLSGRSPLFLEFDEASCERCSDDAVRIYYGGFISFLRSRILTSGLTAYGGTPGVGFNFGASLTGLVTLTECRVGSQGKHGYSISASSARITLLNCAALNCSFNSAGVDYGLFIGAGADGVQVIGGQYGGDNFGDVSSPRQKFGIGVGSGATNTVIVGADVRGNVTGGMVDNGTGTKIRGVVGWESEAAGTASGVTPDGAGNVSIPHGLSNNASYASVGLLGDTVGTGVEVQALGATNITARFYNEATGADVTSGTFDVMWHARTTRA